MWLDADFLTLIDSVKFVVIAQATTIYKLLTFLRLVVVEISVGSSVTSAN